MQVDLTYTPAASAATEVVWPDCDPGVLLRGQFDGLTGNTNTDYTVFHGCLTGLRSPLPLSNYTGNFVELRFACSAEASQTEVLQLPYEATSVLTSQETSGSVFSVEPGLQIIPKLTNLTINCGEPAPVGGISLDSDLRPLPLDTSGASGRSYGVVTLSIAIAAVGVAGVAALAGIGWYATRRRIS